MSIRRRFALAIAFLAFPWAFSFARHSNRDSAAMIVKEISKNNIYEVSYYVGYFGSMSVQYQLFEKLLTLASDEQLVHFAIKAKNGVARLYCYQALKARKAGIPDDLRRQFNNDHTIVQTLKGCTGDKSTISFLANKGLFNPLEYDSTKYRFNL